MSAFFAGRINQNEQFCQPCSLCTYSLSGPNLVYQAIYVCQTCSPGSDKCCCAGCANTCHNGHDVSFLAMGQSYCDCAMDSNCLIVKYSCASARKLLQTNDLSIYLSSRREVKLDPFQEYIITCKDSSYYAAMSDCCAHLVQHSKETFWLDDTIIPSCYLEFLVQKIYYFHKLRLGSHIAVSGAEWWVQVKPLVSDGRLSAIDLHYDKDEDVAEEFAVGVFPLISTVTYLTHPSELASPTIVFDSDTRSQIGDDISKCIVSWGREGKHVAFDGQLLHGAPSEPKLRSMGGKVPIGNAGDGGSIRVTLLVNIWAGHRPTGAVPLPQTIGAAVNSCIAPVGDDVLCSLCVETATQNSMLAVNVAASDVTDDDTSAGSWAYLPFVSDDSIWGKDEDEAGLRLRMWIPEESFLAARNVFSTAALGSTLYINYLDSECAARLEYEEEEDFVDDMADEVEVALNV